jgi:hypothetical protein
MTFINPDNPNNSRTIEAFDIVGFSGDLTEDLIYMNFISTDSANPGKHIVEGSLIIKDFDHLKLIRDSLNKAVEDINEKIGK